MGAFLVRRLGLSMLSLIGVLVVMFLVMQMAPVDPARQYAGSHASPEKLAEVRTQLGLDQPMAVQLVAYVKNFFTGSWGESLVSKNSVLQDVGKTLPYTLELVFLASVLIVAVGVPLGVVSAQKKDLWPDHASRIFAVGLISIPTFWLALALQYVLSGKLGFLPLSGPGTLEVTYSHPIQVITGFPLVDSLVSGNFTAFWDHTAHLVLPVAALTGMALGEFQRITRSSMVESLTEDYIAAKRSYGLRERTVLYRHGLKNSSAPILTIFALQVAFLIVNTFLIESIFAWPGIGAYIARAVTTLDYPVIIAVTLVSAVAFITMNTLADLMIAGTDPRVRLGG